MKVFKFGGASIKDAEAIRNMTGILKNYNEHLIVVVSAMGKTTNALELVLFHYFNRDERIKESLQRIIDFHTTILKELFAPGSKIFLTVERIFSLLETKLQAEPTMTYNFEYDQVVPFGEILSTTIVAEYLNESGILCNWVDIRKVLKTDSLYREANVNFSISESLVMEAFGKKGMYLTQGFIASDENNLTTTLGREGSDYTAALLAYFLDAEGVTVWKDVPGVLNADPKWFDNTVKLETLSYTDAIELAFYGASVIHPKTIQPLKKKNIPLWVKSFYDPEASGTMIGNAEYTKLIPCFIFKMDQVLIDVYPADLSFIAEENLQHIFQIFAEQSLKINMMQNTAVRFRICVNNDPAQMPVVVINLQNRFQVKVQERLELITIRYFDQATIDRVMVNKELILEQRSQTTVQLLVRDLQ